MKARSGSLCCRLAQRRARCLPTNTRSWNDHRSHRLMLVLHLASAFVFAMAISSCSDRSVSEGLVFEKEYTISNGKDKLVIRVLPYRYGNEIVREREAVVQIRNASTGKVKCLAEVVTSCPVQGTPEIIENIRITFYDDLSEDGNTNVGKEMNSLRGKEIFTTPKVGVIELESKEEIGIQMGMIVRGQKYRIHLKWL